MSVLIRPAHKEDGAIAALLLAETTGEFGVQVLGLGDADLQQKAFFTWFTTGPNRFSYQETTIAECYGIAVGLMLGFAGRRLTRLELGCARQLLPIYGLAGSLRMLARNRSLTNTKEVEAVEYLLSHLAVEAQFRRQGIARLLLEKAADDCRQAGLKKLVLEVEMTNDAAIRVYRAAGFEIVARLYYRMHKVKLECPGFYKMCKSI